ncbi:MAG: lipopolysaccharide biosynthesis protein [Rubrivivax sp.]|nr:lipopolysaccharide biosynthesis protein [Rubrivivax sp.]HRI91232.1 Wzz/FepE/Etk N-terminal domain-containing protein [Accumulibacter sp.]
MTEIAQDRTAPTLRDNGTDAIADLVRRLPLMLALALTVSLLAWASSFLFTRIYTARTVLIPPQQQQSAASLALQNLGALAGIAGATAGVKSPVDQYVALLQSRNATDAIIDQFELGGVYEKRWREDVLRQLAKRTRISVGRRDGLIVVEVDDDDPRRAADIANAYVDQLRRLTSEFAITEAQQRRAFFERQLQDAKSNLAAAQAELQKSGFGEAAIRAEPRAIAESYARLRAEKTATEVRLQGLRNALSDQAPEVQRAMAQLQALKQQLARIESSASPLPDGEYISRYREFKYQEALMELFLRQYELARVDESREGPLVQVVDVASPPERHSRPRHVLIGALAGGLTLVLIPIAIAVGRRVKSAARSR